ncbi:hypothetical protein GCM10023224_15660 [Streptomonospora halophila]|uniref:YcaO domain-containing protein n=1 Tax=Streptomonospora halophila TaxID=427369 RepID=A0ABP9GEI1_9ACTN
MITLVHTGLQVPHTRIRVTHVDQLETPRGIAWTARLCEDSTLLGTISNTGHGGPTEFTPASAQARHVVEEFVTACRSGDGQPVDEEAVLDALDGEYEYAALVAQADADRTHVVRGFDASGIPQVFEFRTRPGRPFDYALARASAPHLALGPRIVRAELWMGDRWEEFYRSG